MKYFLLSIFSSAFLLFGFSYLYGVAGTTNLPAIHHWHTKICNHQGERLTLSTCCQEHINAFLTAVSDSDDMPVAFQRIAQRLEQERVIINQQDPQACSEDEVRLRPLQFNTLHLY